MARKILSQKFFNRPADIVAKNLIGKFLVRKKGGREIRALITEAEAYMGPHDMACHAYKGKTKRNEAMFGPAGYWYVYFCYGMHWMLNVVTGPKDYPAAVLIRAAICNTYEVKSRKVVRKIPLSGPGRLTKFLEINRKFNGKRAGRETRLWIENCGSRALAKFLAIRNDCPYRPVGFKIRASPRIGVDYAGLWAKKRYRYWMSLDDS